LQAARRKLEETVELARAAPAKAWQPQCRARAAAWRTLA